MLSSVKIEGFKAVKYAELPLSPLTLLIGRNGSGKSSAIEALQWLQESLIVGLQESTLERFGKFDDLVNRRAEIIGLTLVWDKPGRSTEHVRYSLWVKSAAATGAPIVEHEECVLGRTAGARWVIRSSKGKGGPAVRSIHLGHPVREGDALALSRLDERRQPIAVNAFEAYLRTAVFLRLSPATLENPGRLLPRGRGPLLDQEGAGLVGLLASMRSTQKQRLIGRVAEVLDSVKDVKIVSRGDIEGILTVTEKMRSRGGTKNFDIPAWLLSEGTRRLVAIFALLEASPRPGLIVIEEIENGLDPWTLTHVFNALRDASAQGTQIILTTHSPFLLDHVEPSQVIHVRREKGDTSYTPMRDYEEVTKYEGVVAPGAMYISKFLTRADWKSSS